MRRSALLMALIYLGCGDDTTDVDGGPLPDGSIADGGGADNGGGVDSGGADATGADGSMSDAISPTDGGADAPMDAGPPFDAGPPPAPLELTFERPFPIFGMARVAGGHLVVGRDSRERATQRQALAAFVSDTPGASWAQHLGAPAEGDQYLALTQSGAEQAVAAGISRRGGNDLLQLALFDATGIVTERAFRIGNDAIAFDVWGAGDSVVAAGRVDNRPTIFITNRDLEAVSTVRLTGVQGQFLGVWASETQIVAVGDDASEPGNTIFVAVFAREGDSASLRTLRALSAPGVFHRLASVGSDGTTLSAVGQREGTGFRWSMGLDGSAPSFHTLPTTRQIRQVDVASGRYAGELRNDDMFTAEGDSSASIVSVTGTRAGGFNGRPAILTDDGALASLDDEDNTVIISRFSGFGRIGCSIESPQMWQSVDGVMLTTPDNGVATPGANARNLTLAPRDERFTETTHCE